MDYEQPLTGIGHGQLDMLVMATVDAFVHRAPHKRGGTGVAAKFEGSHPRSNMCRHSSAIGGKSSRAKRSRAAQDVTSKFTAGHTRKRKLWKTEEGKTDEIFGW